MDKIVYYVDFYPTRVVKRFMDTDLICDYLLLVGMAYHTLEDAEASKTYWHGQFHGGVALAPPTDRDYVFKLGVGHSSTLRFYAGYTGFHGPVRNESEENRVRKIIEELRAEWLEENRKYE